MDWRVHKLLCGNYLNFATPAPPLSPETHRRAIIFTPGQEQPRPRFGWVQTETGHIPGEPEFQIPQLKAYEDQQTGKLVREQYHFDTLRNRSFAEHALEIRYSDTFLVDPKMPLNFAVASIVAHGGSEGEGAGTSGKMWRGPLVCLKYEDYLQVGKDGQFTGMPNPYPKYGNMDMRDFRRIADFILNWTGMKNLESCYPDAKKTESNDVKKPKLQAKGNIKGVRVNCIKDQTMDHAIMEETTITHEELAKLKKFNPPLLKAIGLDVDVVKIPSPPAWSADQRAHDNPAVTFFFITIDPNVHWFGLAPLEWQSFVGSVKIFRKDGTELTPKELELAWSYVSDHVVDSMSDGPSAYAMKMLTPEAYAKYKDNKSKGI